jgi:peptidoglycan hydrolase-like protein with peptidoglycan-binding domain
MRWRVVAVLTSAALITACADSRDAQPDDTIPRITSDSTSTTTTEPPTTGAAATTVAPTNAPTPLPTQATSPPPATSPPTLPPAAPPTAPPPTAPATTRPAGPTSTAVVTAGEAATCSSDAIGSNTGDLVIEDVRCTGGWAIGLIDGCPQGAQCQVVDVFRATGEGWEYAGNFPSACPEALTQSGMSIYTALAFIPAPCQGDPGPTQIIRPGSTGERVTQLQTALAALGYDLNVDGRYGPLTQAAVRDFQGRHGLEVDGIAGPRTQQALGIGPGAAQAATAISAPATTQRPGATSTVVIAAGEPVECTPAVISADTGRAVESVSCAGGWAVAPAPCPPGAIDCPHIDVFHIADDGWVYDDSVADSCVDDLTATGMSVYTAAEFAELCADGLPPRHNILPGSRGPEVEQVQIALVALGYPLAIDGTYGARTEAAVRDFQAANNLEVDGIAGPNTQTALGV